MLKRVHTWLGGKNKTIGSDFRGDLTWTNTGTEYDETMLVRGQRKLVDGRKG